MLSPRFKPHVTSCKSQVAGWVFCRRAFRLGDSYATDGADEAPFDEKLATCNLQLVTRVPQIMAAFSYTNLECGEPWAQVASLWPDVARDEPFFRSLVKAHLPLVQPLAQAGARTLESSVAMRVGQHCS